MFTHMHIFLKMTCHLKWINLYLPETEGSNWSSLHLNKVQQHKIWVHFHKFGSGKSKTLYLCHCCTQVKQHFIYIYSLSNSYFKNIFCVNTEPMRHLRCTETWNCERPSYKISSLDFCPRSRSMIKLMVFGICPVIRYGKSYKFCLVLLFLIVNPVFLCKWACTN